MMRKIIPVLLALMLLAGCNTTSNTPSSSEPTSNETADYRQISMEDAINIPNESYT